jgi:nucleotide-binding universal stress UspA family protein
MTAEKILFATDFSPASDAALGFASSLASDSGAVLHIVHVGVSHADAFATTAPYGYAISEEVELRERKEREAKLDSLRPTVAGVSCERHDLEGNPAEEVLRFAEEEGVDLIVVGSHGRTGLSRMLMGSVAEEIVRRADCPVLVVKHAASLIE